VGWGGGGGKEICQLLIDATPEINKFSTPWEKKKEDPEKNTGQGGREKWGCRGLPSLLSLPRHNSPERKSKRRRESPNSQGGYKQLTIARREATPVGTEISGALFSSQLNRCN